MPQCKGVYSLLTVDCNVAVTGQEAIDSFKLAHESKRPYDVIFMDIMMPIVDGLEALHCIRALEKKMAIPPQLAVRVIMTTALDDSVNIKTAFREQCEGYLVKPIDRQKLIQKIKELDLIKE